MLSQLGIEASPAVTYAIAFASIFVLLTLFALVLRRLTGGRSRLSGQGGRTRQPRLGIVDVYDLDRQRQLILLRRDNVEHLLLIGGPNDVVIETNIVRVPGVRLHPAPDLVPETAHEAVPARPSVEALPARNGAADAGSVGASLQPGLARTEAVLKPDVVALETARPQARRPEPAPPPSARSDTPRRSAPIPPALGPAPEARPHMPDAAVLTDMAKQLEEALKRPAAPVRPPEPPPASPPPPPPVPPPRTEQQAVSARPPAPRPAPPPPVRPSEPAPPAPAPRAEAPPKPVLRPEPPPVAKAEAPPKPEPAPKPDGAPEAQPRVSDPFSVEEIEAEFARLLGRPLEKDKGEKA